MTRVDEYRVKCDILALFLPYQTWLVSEVSFGALLFFFAVCVKPDYEAQNKVFQSSYRCMYTD